MDSYDQVKDRFHFSLPDDYLRFWIAGLLLNDIKRGLKVSRYSWLAPENIADCEWPTYKIKSLVPCARTHGRGHYCWFAEESKEPWIAECPRDSDFAEGVAPQFEGFVFRSLLEEFADTWLTEELGEVAAIYPEYAQRVGAVLRPNWTEILVQCASQKPTFNRWNRPQVISQEQASSIIMRELEFPWLSKQFTQHVGF